MRDYWCLEIKHKSFSHVSVILWQCLHLTQISHFESQFFALLLFLKDSLLFKLQLFFSFFFLFASILWLFDFTLSLFHLTFPFGRQAAVVQRIVLEPAVLLKSFQTPFTIRYSQRKKKAPPLTSSHLSDLKKKKKIPCRGNFDRALILCYNFALFTLTL